MGKDLATTLADLAEHLTELVRRNDHLHDQLQSLVRAILEPINPVITRPETETGSEGETGAATIAEPEPLVDPRLVSEGVSDPGPPAVSSRIPIDVVMPPEPPAEPLRKLTLGQAQPRPKLVPTIANSYADAEDELTGIEPRLRLKADGLRWALRRRQMEIGGDFRREIAPLDRELLERASAIRCVLWMNRPDYVVPVDPGAVETAAQWFEAVALAVELARETEPGAGNSREHREPALVLMAEAQSALRVAILGAGGHDDPDQFLAYQWLRSITKRESIYIHRYMRLDDPANPADPAACVARVANLRSRLSIGRNQAKKSDKLFKKFRHHARLIANQGGGDHSHDWRKMADAVDGLVHEGHPASAIDLRELLLPILDLIPDDLGETSPTFGRVLREVDTYRDSVSEPAGSDPTPTEPAEEVARVARILQGKTMVLIGGQCRPRARDALKAALRLKDLDWISSREHTSIDRFEPNVTRPGVALVALAIRWSSHSYGEVKELCDRHDKPMVRLPGGYGTNQVAAQILAQCSGQFPGD